MEDLRKPKKALGQHWLYDQGILTAIAEAADIGHDDTVLEIGPGTGTLTRELCMRAGQVVAVEFDPILAAALTREQLAENLVVVHQDILRFDLTSLPAGYKVVANIPYYLTSNLIRVLSESRNPARSAVLLMQAEVARRAAAQPGQMSLLSVTTQYYWEARSGIDVPAHFFVPPPKVDSQLLILTRRDTPLFADVPTKQYFHVVKAGFSSKRKTLHNSLSAGLRLDKRVVAEALQHAGIDLNARAQSLSLDDWHRLSRLLLEKT